MGVGGVAVYMARTESGMFIANIERKGIYHEIETRIDRLNQIENRLNEMDRRPRALERQPRGRSGL